jgi:hypothetical protein
MTASKMQLVLPRKMKKNIWAPQSNREMRVPSVERMLARVTGTIMEE